MRSLFSGTASAAAPVPSATPAPSSGGWDGLSGAAKLAVCGAVAVVVVGAVVLPGFFDKKTAPAAPNYEQHPPGRISDYEPPPPATDMFTRAGTLGDTNAASLGRRRRPVPTEMALYTPTGTQAHTKAAEEARADAAGIDPGAGVGAGRVGLDPSDRLAASVGGATRLPTMRATLVRNADFVIRAGDVIPCLPVDALNSSRPGFTSCKVPEWFRSSNQRRGLLPPGTRIFGQIRSGLAAGEMRLGVLYTLIQTPRFNMPVAAPAADEMGRAGLDGDVNTFFWDKAGAVALYALMDVGIGAGQNLASSALSRAFNGNSGGTTLNLGGQAQGLASQQFGATINRPPVLTRDQALPMTVTVGQDLDFSEACKLAMQADPMACPLQ